MPIIFGLDPSLRSTGYGIIRAEGREMRALAYGVIKNPDRLTPSRCLVAIHRQITALLQQHKPDAAAVEGRVVQIAFLSGPPQAKVNFAKLMVKRLHHTGSTLRPRSNADKAAMVAAIEAKVMPLLREGRVKPVMDSTFPLEKAADAHRRMESSEHIGKIVLVA